MLAYDIIMLILTCMVIAIWFMACMYVGMHVCIVEYVVVIHTLCITTKYNSWTLTIVLTRFFSSS